MSKAQKYRERLESHDATHCTIALYERLIARGEKPKDAYRMAERGYSNRDADWREYGRQS